MCNDRQRYHRHRFPSEIINPHDIDPDTIKEIEVVRTMFCHRTMHSLAG